jgi:hypothetical protein
MCLPAGIHIGIGGKSLRLLCHCLKKSQPFVTPNPTWVYPVLPFQIGQTSLRVPLYGCVNQGAHITALPSARENRQSVPPVTTQPTDWSLRAAVSARKTQTTVAAGALSSIVNRKSQIGNSLTGINRNKPALPGIKNKKLNAMQLHALFKRFNPTAYPIALQPPRPFRTQLNTFEHKIFTTRPQRNRNTSFGIQKPLATKWIHFHQSATPILHHSITPFPSLQPNPTKSNQKTSPTRTIPGTPASGTAQLTTDHGQMTISQL